MDCPKSFPNAIGQIDDICQHDFGWDDLLEFSIQYIADYPMFLCRLRYPPIRIRSAYWANDLVLSHEALYLLTVEIEIDHTMEMVLSDGIMNQLEDICRLLAAASVYNPPFYPVSFF